MKKLRAFYGPYVSLTVHLVLLLIVLETGDGLLAMIEAVAAAIDWLMVRGDLVGRTACQGS
jgi:hypothetical protein